MLVMKVEDLKTGDILLFKNSPSSLLYSMFDYLISFFTTSEITHIGMIVENPRFTNPFLDGKFLWQSGIENKVDPQDGKMKFGVQLTPIDEILEDYKNGEIFVRRMDLSITQHPFNYKTLKDIHSIVYKKPYDTNINDWIKALEKHIKNDNQRTDNFWCSALVGYIYTKCGILKSDTEWSIMKPSDFSLEEENLNFNDNYKFIDEEYKLEY